MKDRFRKHRTRSAQRLACESCCGENLELAWAVGGFDERLEKYAMPQHDDRITGGRIYI